VLSRRPSVVDRVCELFPLVWSLSS
jgi:hypothetical protein